MMTIYVKGRPIQDGLDYESGVIAGTIQERSLKSRGEARAAGTSW